MENLKIKLTKKEQWIKPFFQLIGVILITFIITKYYLYYQIDINKGYTVKNIIFTSLLFIYPSIVFYLSNWIFKDLYIALKINYYLIIKEEKEYITINHYRNDKLKKQVKLEKNLYISLIEKAESDFEEFYLIDLDNNKRQLKINFFKKVLYKRKERIKIKRKIKELLKIK